MNGFLIPDAEEFHKGLEAFERNEPRGYAYFNALSHVSQNWGNPDEMASGIGELLHSWHQAFYRFGDFDFNELKACIETNLEILNKFRGRSIKDLSDSDEEDIKTLFNKFLDALKGINKRGIRRSPVAVAKALNLLAPNFFPLWDTEIGIAYNCWWVFSEFGALEYVSFFRKMQDMAEQVKHYVPDPDDRSILKRIDEYNYAKYTYHWI